MEPWTGRERPCQEAHKSYTMRSPESLAKGDGTEVGKIPKQYFRVNLGSSPWGEWPQSTVPASQEQPVGQLTVH